MLEFEKALFVIALSLTAWSICALWLDKQGYSRVNRGFALLLACLCIPQAYFYSRLVLPPHGSYFLGLSAQAVIWLKGPLLLAMVRLVIGDSLTSYWRHLLVFPIALGTMLLWPQWAIEFNMLGLVGLLVYLGYSLARLRVARARLTLIYRGYQNSAYYWLMFVVFGLLALVAVDVVIMLLAYVQRHFWIEAIKLVNWLMSAYLLAIAFFSLYRPGVFFHQGRDEDAGQPTLEEGPSFIKAESTEKSWRELNESLAQSLAAELGQLMERDQLFRKNDLSLADLAGRLGISVHQASELLNVHLNANFYDYINRHRLAYACQLLRDPKCQWRVLDIAFEAGFSNKNSFYRYFRQCYQQTPVEYRNRELGLAAA